MNLVHIIIGILILISCLEIIKYLFLKRTVKITFFILIIFILFLCFSYTFKEVENFKDNKFIQAWAVVAGELTDFFKEKVDPEYIVNSTVKSNKLFKD